ncbi:hypothetical protein VK98_15455 [Chromobacterium sp. LK11]|nr:hypothetical protein VK98_15455 [Chromobacterium sp. LK11]
MLNDFEQDPDYEKMLESLFLMHLKSMEAMEYLKDGSLKPEVMALFQRFWKEDKPAYRALLSLLAIFNLADIQDGKFNSYKELKEVILGLAKEVDGKPSIFVDSYIKSFKAIAMDVLRSKDDREKMLQSMYTHIASINFNNMLTTISLL